MDEKMCGRFFVDAKDREIDRLLEKLPPDAGPVKTGEVFPSENALILARRHEEILPESMSWGFPRSTGKRLIFNARSETALQKPFFAHALKKNPVAVPVSGFYEWLNRPERKTRAKYLFRNPEGGLLFLAGFWRDFFLPCGKQSRRFTILTTRANESVFFCHDRMPVILKKDEIRKWLSGSDIPGLLVQAPEPLEAVEIQRANALG